MQQFTKVPAVILRNSLFVILDSEVTYLQQNVQILSKALACSSYLDNVGRFLARPKGYGSLAGGNFIQCVS